MIAAISNTNAHQDVAQKTGVAKPNFAFKIVREIMIAYTRRAVRMVTARRT